MDGRGRTVRKLITLGSSSTAGAGASMPTTRYTHLLAQDVGAHDLLNLGAGGQQHSDVMALLPRVLGALAQDADGGAAVDVVTFLPFTDFANSSGPQIAAGYTPVFQRLAATSAVVLFGVPTVDARYQCGVGGPLRGPDGECYDPQLVEDYAAKGTAVLMAAAPFSNVSLVQVPQTQAQQPHWTGPDGHPNDLGHLFLARVFGHAIRGRLGQDAGPPPEP